MSAVQHFGWIDRPAEVERIVAEMPHNNFRRAAAGMTAIEQDVLYWEMEEKLFGHVMTDWWLAAQGIGDCVSWGWAIVCQDLMMIQAALHPEVGMFAGEVATEPIYGGSRCEVGGDFGSYSDGSIGAWAAKWVSTRGGLLIRKDYGNGLDLSTYSAKRAKDYGAKGCPDSLEPEARLHPVKTVIPVTTYEATRDALCNLYPVAVASDVGYTESRDQNGFCYPSGRWNHEMKYRGHCIVKGNKPAVVQSNNWGDNLGSKNNKVTLESGREVTLPPGHFLITPEACTRQVRQNDSFLASHLEGYQPLVPQKLSWLV